MLTIASFNIKNDYKQYNKDKTKSIIKFLKKEKIDILCFQELFSKCSNDLENNSNIKEYKLYGKYRYKLKIFDSINEKTAVLTNKEVIEQKTFHLPWLPSGLKRVATKVVINSKNIGDITIINTHLDYKYNFTKKRQLKSLLKIIKNIKTPIILTGDFNMKINHEIFKQFIYELEKINIIRIPINEKTLKQSKYNRAIDHIFISKDLKIESYKVIKDLQISDHYPIIVKLFD